MPAQAPARIVILSGARGVGKSAVCLSTVDRAQKRGYMCGGVVTLRRPDDALDVLNVRSGAVRRLTPKESAEGVAVVQGRFHFDSDTLAWGNAVLGHALPCHLLVVDELGPLELERSQGWIKAFDVLHRGEYSLALVVAWPELVAEAQRRLPSGTTAILTTTIENRDDLPAVLVTMLEAQIN